MRCVHLVGLVPSIAVAWELDRQASVLLAVLGSRPRTTMSSDLCHRNRLISTHMGRRPAIHDLRGLPQESRGRRVFTRHDELACWYVNGQGGWYR
jgi:hypothetical protein